MVGAIILLVLGLKQWGQFNRWYLFGGIFTWILVILLTNQFATWNEIGLILLDQIQLLGLFTLISITVIISASIPRLLFQLGQSSSVTQSKKNWLIFFGFYLANLILSYGNSYLAWEIKFSIPTLFFLLVSWISYSLQVSNMHAFLRWGLTLGSLGTLLLFECTGNDAGLQALEHWTLICSILTLALFPLFIYSNFNTPIQQNLPVYKIVHKAPHIDLRIIYIGVTILGMAWVFAKNGTVWHQFQAAIYNERGDIALLNQDKQEAAFAYQQAMIHSKLNCKSNVSLAALALEANDLESAAYYLSTANVRHAKPSHFIALASIYQQANKAFEALFTLQQAQQKFPKSIEINTQLARQFEYLQSVDSSQFYYELAFRNAPDNPISVGNYLYSTKKIPANFNEQEDPAVLANQIAISLKMSERYVGQTYETSHYPSRDLRAWALIYNLHLWAKSKADIIPEKWVADPETRNNFPEIKLIDAWQDYHHGKCLQALQKVNLLISADSTSNTAGLQQILDFWKQSLLEPRSSSEISNWKQAQAALAEYPFQIEVLQKSITILNQAKKEKQGYDAALAALQWNEHLPVYYLIYAMQAYHIGEITYGNEAIEALIKLSPSTYEANKSILTSALTQATQRQKFN
jgi:hypothetical protein